MSIELAVLEFHSNEKEFPQDAIDAALRKVLEEDPYARKHIRNSDTNDTLVLTLSLNIELSVSRAQYILAVLETSV